MNNKKLTTKKIKLLLDAEFFKLDFIILKAIQHMAITGGFYDKKGYGRISEALHEIHRNILDLLSGKINKQQKVEDGLVITLIDKDGFKKIMRIPEFKPVVNIYPKINMNTYMETDAKIQNEETKIRKFVCEDKDNLIYYEQ